MKIFKEGEKSKAICSHCGMVETVFQTRDVPVHGSKTVAKNILAGVCTICDEVVSIPQQSALYVKEALQKDKKPLEIRIPKHLEDILANASLRLVGDYSPVVVNFLIRYYIHKSFSSLKERTKLQSIYDKTDLLKNVSLSSRLSIRIDSKLFDEFQDLKLNTEFKNDSELIKAIMLKINNDIVQEKDSKVVDELKDLAIAM
jgi:hypothetical protein